MRVLVLAAALLCSGCPIVVGAEGQDANARCAVFLQENRLDEADAACDLALEYQPRYWDALHNKGLIALQRGDPKKAKPYFIAALRAHPHMKASQNALGAIALQAGQLADAEERFRAALEVDPQYLEARRNLGVVHLQQSSWAEAVKDFRQLTMIAPTLVEAHVGLAAALLPLKKYDEAGAALERATTLDVNADHAWKLRGDLERVLGRLDESKEAYERCLLANEGNLECKQALESLSSR